MKKLLLIMFSLLFSQQVFANEWISVFYSGENKPNVLTLPYQTKEQCQEWSEHLAKGTEKFPDYKYSCSIVLNNNKKIIWIFVMWPEKMSEPIVLPIAFNNKSECKKETIKINQITEKTINIKQNFDCNHLMTFNWDMFKK